jgi:hypothetical protein
MIISHSSMYARVYFIKKKFKAHDYFTLYHVCASLFIKNKLKKIKAHGYFTL